VKARLYGPGRHPSGSDGAMRELDVLGMPPVRLSQSAQLFTSGDGIFAGILELVGSAHVSIELATFIFSRDPVGDAVLAALVAKARAGVKVRVLLDSVGAFMARSSSFKELKASGGRVAFFMPLFHPPWRGRTNLRNHRKILVVDGARALVGGMNVAKEYMGPGLDPARWIDLALRCEGAAVGDLLDVFEEDWAFAARAALSARLGTPPVPGTGDCSLRIVGSGPDVEGDPLYDALLSLIFEARERIWIATPYFIPDETLGKALALAGRRGVDVRILVPRKSNHIAADLARGSYLFELSQSGCRVALARKMMHAKTVIVDRNYGLVGSANFDMRSLLFNYEIGALVGAGNALDDLHAWFEVLFSESARYAASSSAVRDVVEGIGRVLGPLI
ncbi:MAG: phospholipase D-like domain-containing protein, partial [bacterium]